ncbi:MAG TPA: hypothetical protein VM427_06890 [Patescibacteria group bacterium]|nr:hypothetical protein [Patescibacteria group bacterium]
MEFVTIDGRRVAFCEEHGQNAKMAVNEVLDHLVRSGHTYLQSTAATVLVEYVIKPDQEEDFRRWRELGPPSPAGFVGETLYWAEWDGEPDDGNLHFVNIGHWSPRQAFYDHFKTQPGQEIRRMEFEDGRRRRAFLRRDS